MKVKLRNPNRELEVNGPISVVKLLNELDLNRESVLVISGDTLIPADAVLDDCAEVEIRPVISGGAIADEPAAAPRTDTKNPMGPRVARGASRPGAGEGR